MALGGMLLINLGAISGITQSPLLYQGGDWLASLLTLLLVEGKFYPMFAFLFGWGIARRQAFEDHPESFFISNLRRMAVLAVFGLLHAALLWEGDILFVYALVGMLLPLLRGAPVRLLAVMAASMLLLSAFMAMPGYGARLHAAYSGWIAPILTDWPGSQASGAWASLPSIRLHLAQFAWKLAYFPDWLGNFLALILAGYASEAAHPRDRLPLRVVFTLSLPLNFFYALSGAYPYMLPADWTVFFRRLALSLGGPLLALGYSGLLVRLYQTRNMRAAFELLRRIGRMPLTTYLSQSLIGWLLLRWLSPGTLTPALAWCLTGAIFLFQVLFANLWLRRRQQGPVEWLWKKLSPPVAPKD
jgi:uncharacterized protein